MGSKTTKKKILKFLGVNYDKKINISTFANIPWEEISFQIIETRKEYLIKKLSIMNGLSFFQKMRLSC